MCCSKDYVTHLNMQANRDIRSLRVYCSNKKEGFEWQGEMNAIAGHLNNNKDGCQFQEISCPSDCGVAYQ